MFKLRSLMFGHFFVLGGIAPLLNLYLLNDLGFRGWQAGVIVSLGSIGLIAGTLTNALVADRLVRSERLYSGLKLISAITPLLLCRVRTFAMVFTCYALFSVTFGPGGTVMESVVFHHMPPGRRNHFGSVRVFATFGWVGVAWLLPLVDKLAQNHGIALSVFQLAFILGIVGCLMNVGIMLSLPKRTLPQRTSAKRFLPAEALAVFRSPPALLLTACTFCTGFLDRYFFFVIAPYLKSLGVQDAYVLRTMSMGQILEIFGLFSLAWLLAKAGFRTVMLVGALLHVCRFSLLAFGGSYATAVAGTILHGAAFAFYFVPATMCFERLCSREALSGAYLLFTVVTAGLSGLASSLIGGMLFDMNAGYLTIWLVPLGVCLFPLIWAAAQFFPRSGRHIFTPATRTE